MISRQRRQPLDEKRARGRVRLKPDRQMIGAARRFDVAHFRAKIGARDPIGFESVEPALGPHLIQQFQSRSGPMRMRDRRRAIDGDDRRGGQGEQRVVEDDDRLPVGRSGQPAGGVDRLDRRLELKASRRAEGARRLQQPLGFLDRRLVPALDRLLAQRNIAPLGVASRLAPRMGVEHQRQQAHRLRLVRNERDDDAAEPDRLLGEIAPARIVGERFRPAVRKSGVNRLQRNPEPLGQVLALGDLERHAGQANFRLGAGEALAHRRRRHQEGRSDRRRVEAEDRLQHQRRANGLLDRRMGAGEHQREPPVGIASCVSAASFNSASISSSASEAGLRRAACARRRSAAVAPPSPASLQG